jgi:hypothetical protein
MAPTANASSAYLPRQLTVRFEGGRAPADFAEVMARLGREGLLPLEVYVDREGATPAEILARTGRLAGSSVAPAYERYLCDINRHLCEPSKTLVWRNVRAQTDAPLPDLSCPVTRSEDRPRYALCLPMVQVRPYRTAALVQYTAGKESLEAVIGRHGGCPKLDDACRRMIRGLNQLEKGGEDVFAPSFSGLIRIPVQAYGVTLTVTSEQHLERVTEAVDGVIGRLRRDKQLTKEHRSIHYTMPTPTQKWWHPFDPAQADPGDYVARLRAMDYPFLRPADFLQSALVPVMVGVWDTFVDADHCDLVLVQGQTRVGHFEPRPIGREDPPRFSRASECGVPRQCEGRDGCRKERWDHGTHVAGIIAARLNGHGIAGVNPTARLWAYEVGDEAEAPEVDDDPILRLHRRDKPLPSVINISLAVTANGGGESRLESLVKAYAGAFLFVAAAGNDAARIADPSSCHVRPACLSTDLRQGKGVISVVALDRSGKARLAKSNFGPVFDVAAVGEAVSTLDGNFLGSADGTSVAAPHVTGLASLIYARALGLLPRLVPRPPEVKERILATADFSDTLDDVVQFGRINFRRALAFPGDVLVLKSPICGGSRPCEVKGRVRKTPAEEIRVIEGNIGGVDITTPRPIKVKHIRRIAAKDETPDSRYWVVYVDDLNPQGPILRKIVDAKFDGSPVLRFEGGGAEAIAQVLDYTCGLPCDPS